MGAEDGKKSFEFLADPTFGLVPKEGSDGSDVVRYDNTARCARLDSAIVSVTGQFSETLKRKHKERRTKQFNESRKPFAGRQMAFMFIEHLNTDESILATYNITTLQNLKWIGDREHEMRRWLHIARMLKKPIFAVTKDRTAEKRNKFCV